MKTTNLEELKTLALAFLHLDPTFDKDMPFIIIHPYIENVITSDSKGNLIDIREPEQLKKFIEMHTQKINNAKSITDIMCHMRTPYHFTFLKYAKPYMSKTDFDKWLSETWIMTENPNQDKNVSINQFIRWFSKADKNIIMNEEEYKYYNSLPDTVNIYRGVAVGRANEKGLSWTDDIETAKWFAKRFNHDGKKGYLLSAKINKKDIFAYFNSRNEKEILCDSRKTFDLKKTTKV